MTKFIPLIALGLTAAALPQIAAANSVTLDPGLYDYTHVVLMGGRPMMSDANEVCVKAGENSRTLEELTDALSGEGECTLSNVNMTETTGRADLICTDIELGMDISGTLLADFGPDFYNVKTKAKLGPLPVEVLTKVKRRGECADEMEAAE